MKPLSYYTNCESDSRLAQQLDQLITESGNDLGLLRRLVANCLSLNEFLEDQPEYDSLLSDLSDDGRIAIAIGLLDIVRSVLRARRLNLGGKKDAT